MKKYLFLLVLLVLFVAIGFGVGTFNPARWQQPVACTAEAKLCPDGSSVGRTGPKCEFADCPAAIATSTASVSQSGNIKVYTPRPNDLLAHPFLLTGEARVFEGAFSYRLLNASGGQIAAGFSNDHQPDAGQFGPFSVSVGYEPLKDATGTLEVFTRSPKDGAVIDLVKIPVQFAQ